MAKALYDGGGMHGDLALIEATMSAQEFFHLVKIGVRFPHNEFGAYVGYKTDHDPRQRATSAGPWTSNQMVQCLRKEVERKKIPLLDKHEVIALLVSDKRAMGLIAVDKSSLEKKNFGLTFFFCKNIVFGVGGPGGIYRTSVYPENQLGGIGLALEVGAVARNLTESQYGLASIKYRWNVSGTYQQVIPRYISTGEDGKDEVEFLNDYFPSMGKLATNIFLKGYQWPFDPRKIPGLGSSVIDVLVYNETVIKGRRVFMDFRENPRGDDRIGSFSFDHLESEAYQYLEKSGALFGTPLTRLEKMNPMAIELYAKNGINLSREPLEVAVCAQHNNGGLAGDIWWESNIDGMFPVGEVNGSHGVYRPGGSALNSGQVGSLRAALRIAYGERGKPEDYDDFIEIAQAKGTYFLDLLRFFMDNIQPEETVSAYRDEFQNRMTETGSHIRNPERITEALEQAYAQISRFKEQRIADIKEIPTVLQNRHLALAHAAYLDAIRAYLEKGGGSRGSYLVLDPKGEPVLEMLGASWRYKGDPEKLKNLTLETLLQPDGRFTSQWRPCRPLPEEDSWFETVWGRYVDGSIFDDKGAV
jgi:succinate dehydrogenase/fumarate reductase flavoprotein subunit